MKRSALIPLACIGIFSRTVQHRTVQNKIVRHRTERLKSVMCNSGHGVRQEESNVCGQAAVIDDANLQTGTE